MGSAFSAAAGKRDFLRSDIVIHKTDHAESDWGFACRLLDNHTHQGACMQAGNHNYGKIPTQPKTRGLLVSAGIWMAVLCAIIQTGCDKNNADKDVNGPSEKNEIAV